MKPVANFAIREIRKRIRLPGCWPVQWTFSWSHFTPYGTHHGPQSNPRLLAVRGVRLGVWPPSEGWRTWLYLRGGRALYFDLSIDRRPLSPEDAERDAERAEDWREFRAAIITGLIAGACVYTFLSGLGFLGLDIAVTIRQVVAP